MQCWYVTPIPVRHCGYEHGKSLDNVQLQYCMMKKRWFSYSHAVLPLFVVWEKQKIKQSLIIIHSPSNPGFLFGRTYLLSCGRVTIETVQARHGGSNSSSLCLLSGGNWLWNFSTHLCSNTKIIKTAQGPVVKVAFSMSFKGEPGQHMTGTFKFLHTACEKWLVRLTMAFSTKKTGLRENPHL